MLLLGESLCLITALMWACSITLLRPAIEQHGARTVNMAKCLLGATLQGLTVLAVGQGSAFGQAAPRDLGLLAASGLIGLALGDTALFASVAKIGVHRTLLLQTLAPAFAAGLAAAWQSEVPTSRQALGSAIVLAGIALVVAPEPGAPDVARHWRALGIAAGTLAAAGQGFGITLAKAALEDVPLITASFVRLSTAAVAMLVMSAATGRLLKLPSLVRSPVARRRVLPATLLGTYLSLFLMMVGVDLAPAAVAAVLLSTGPVFSLIIDGVLERRRPSLRSLAGTLLAMAGVVVLVTT